MVSLDEAYPARVPRMLSSQFLFVLHNSSERIDCKLSNDEAITHNTHFLLMKGNRARNKATTYNLSCRKGQMDIIH